MGSTVNMFLRPQETSGGPQGALRGPSGALKGPLGGKIPLRSKVCKNAYQIISTFKYNISNLIERCC